MSDEAVQRINKAREQFEKNLSMYEELANARAEEQMGFLHSQFVAYISGSQLPLHQVLLVLEIIKSEIIEQARERFLGEK